MSASGLRKLAKSYASGNLDKEAYRKKRAVYLESVLSGKISLEEDIPETVTQETESTDRDLASDTLQNAFEITNIPPAGRAKKNQAAKTWLIAVATVGVAAILILVVFLARDNDSGELEINERPESATQAPTATSAAQDLIASFLEQRKWTQESMSAFLDSWQAIPEPDRTEAARSVEMSQLANALYKKLLEERAVSGLGNPESSWERQRQLVQFADEVGIRDPRITPQE